MWIWMDFPHYFSKGSLISTPQKIPFVNFVSKSSDLCVLICINCPTYSPMGTNIRRIFSIFQKFLIQKEKGNKLISKKISINIVILY